MYKRQSVFMAGPLISRLGRAEIYRPGGCRIGMRPIDMHISVFEAFGAKIRSEDEKIVCEAPPGGLKGAEIKLPFPSVGATENAVCTAVLAEGNTCLLYTSNPIVSDVYEPGSTSKLLTTAMALEEGVKMCIRDRLSGALFCRGTQNG